MSYEQAYAYFCPLSWTNQNFTHDSASDMIVVAFSGANAATGHMQVLFYNAHVNEYVNQIAKFRVHRTFRI